MRQRRIAAAPFRRVPGSPVVVQVIPELGAGGAEQTAIDIAAALQESGAAAYVAARGGFRAPALETVGARLIRLPVHTKNPYGMAANVLRLTQLIQMVGADVIHVRSRAPAWSTFAAARLAGIPMVTTYHGTYSAKSALKRFYNSGMTRGDAIIANSHFIADHVVKEHRLSPERIDVIPRGTDMNEFDPQKVGRDRVVELRLSWGVSGEAGPQSPASQRVILLPGRLTEWKGHGVLIDALARMKAAGRHVDNWTAVLMGDTQGRDGYLAALQKQARRLNLADRVVFADHCHDMPAAYLAADVVVSASTSPEAFGRIAVEGQAMGRPVIATDHGGARETVCVACESDQGPTGWRVPPGDAKALAEALQAALDLDWDEWCAVGARARDHVKETYALATMQARTLDVYRRLIEAKGGARKSASGTPEEVLS